jgi:hypothetical protein
MIATGTIDEILYAISAYITAGPSGAIDMYRELLRSEASDRLEAALKLYIDKRIEHALHHAEEKPE